MAKAGACSARSSTARSGISRLSAGAKPHPAAQEFLRVDRRNSCAPGCGLAPADSRLMPDLAVDDLAEQAPAFAIEFHQLHLFDREKIPGAGVDPDTGQQHFTGEVVQARGLLHHVLPREIVTALL